MSIFGKPDDRDQTIANLRSEAEDMAETLSNERQLRSAAEKRLTTMVKARDPAQMAALALSVASQVEDQFARGFEGGHFADGWFGPVQMRRNAIAAIIREAIDRALTGGNPD